MKPNYKRSDSGKSYVKHYVLYIAIVFSLLLIFLQNILDYNYFDSVLYLSTILSAAILFCSIIYFYVNRARYFSLQLLFAFVFSMIIGLPAVYLYFFKDANNGFELICVWGIIINIVLYFQAQNNNIVQQEKSINIYFIVIFWVVAACQIFKVAVYFEFIMHSGLGHLAIYTEGDELLSKVPFVIRAISGFSLVMALAVFYFQSSKTLKLIAFILLVSELLIGIRSKFFFSFICIIVLSLHSNKEQVKNIFLRISRPQYLLLGFSVFSLISYVREGYDMNFLEYLALVLDSLSSTFAGLQKVYSLPAGFGWDSLHQSVIFTQILPMSGLGFIDDNQIAKEFSTIVLGDISNGIALSSSGMLESTILSFNFNVLIYLAYLLLIMRIIQKGLNSSSSLLNFIAIAMLPGFFYAVRGELVLPFAYIIKSFPIIVISWILVFKKYDS